MQLTVFQSGKGDCLLLADTGDKTRILVDGGMPDAYSEHVAPALSALRKKKKKDIDLVYVSHIDQDHIGGILRMLDDEVLWRVHEHQVKSGNRTHPVPSVPRPPKIGGLWHNAFREQLPKQAEPIAETLAAMAPILSGAVLDELRDIGRTQGELASSVEEAMRVSRRIGATQLKIPLNQQAQGKLLMRRKGQKPIKLGLFQITVLAPGAKQLEALRAQWAAWLEKASSKKLLNQLREKSRADEKALGAADFEQLFAMIRLQAEAFGDPASVTPPNLASLMLLVEEAGKSILLTGDGRWDHLVEGLTETGRLDRNGRFSVDILKVPHHGSKNNVVDTDLLDRVIATHYVFCGDGHHGNPGVEVIEFMAKQRVKAPGKFKFWFNSSAAVAGRNEMAHMRDVEQKVRSLAAGTKGKMTFAFLQSGSSFRVI
ncbi:MAG TPA: MBL fold metallo-hydrolase [Vicinamibacterales bacterium]|nr:MBL fold metallo-hydrolase [Vicinamibacterales bacterium]